MNEIERLQQAMAALQAQRNVLGDAVLDAALAPLRERLTQLQSAAAQQLRQVSVLFLDIVGSTALSQQLDPEAVHELVDGLLARCTALVVQHGGRVLQYAGDNLLAAFGAEQTREDDAERAVHAGLALLAEGRSSGADVAARHGREGFDVRVGIHTGPVLLGGGVDAEGSIRGLTVNVAARMEQTAPAGHLRISHDTFAHVRGVFDVDPQPAMPVKGHDTPLLTYLVQRAKPRAFRVLRRGVDGVETPLVGRYRELAVLSQRFEAVLAARRLQAVTVVGDAGLGKSRVLTEFQHALETHPQTFWLLLGRSQPASLVQPYGLLRDLLAWRFQIADSDSAEAARSKLLQGVAAVFPGDDGERCAQLLGQLIGLDFRAGAHLAGLLDDPRLLRAQAFDAGVALLQRLTGSDGSPLVMLLDDLHWADDGSLDFVRHLLMQAREVPLLLVMLARPELFERRPDWVAVGDGDVVHHRVDLPPLSPADSEALAGALLQRLAEVPAALRTLLTSGAEGNPFYMEELLKMLLDDGVIANQGEGWQVDAARLQATRVPGTLVGVLQARLDALAPDERQALQQAAIIGTVFWDQALDALQPGAAAALPTLRRKELVMPRDGSAFDGTVEYVFHHHLLQQVAYDTVLRVQRRAGHAAAAAWLQQRLGDRADEYMAVAADHCERAGDDARALQLFQRAAADAIRRSVFPAALEHVGRALANPALQDPRMRIKVLATQGEALDALARYDQLRQVLHERQGLAEQLGDESLLASALIARALLADRHGEQAEALVLARQASTLAQRNDSVKTAALALGEIAWVLCVQGDLAGAREHAEQGLLWAQRESPEEEAKLLLVAAEIALQASDLPRSEQLLGRARAALHSGQFARRLHCSVLDYSCNVARYLGDLDAAEGFAREVLQQATEIGLRRTQAVGKFGLMEVALLRGALQTALDLAAEIELLSRGMGDQMWNAQLGNLVGQAHARLGHSAAARQALGEALAGHRTVGRPQGARESLGELITLELAAGDGAAAHAWAEQALATFGAMEAAAISPEWAWPVYRALAAAGDARAPGLLRTMQDGLRTMLARIPDEAVRQRMLAVRRNYQQVWDAPSAEGAA